MEITIEKFKNIIKVPLEVNGITMLVGGNNAGKSSALQAIQFGISVAQTSGFQNGTWSTNRLSTSVGQAELLYTPIKDVHALAYNGRLREAVEDAIKITYKDGEKETTITVRKGKNKNILLEIVGEELGGLLQSIEHPFCSLVTGLAGIPADEQYETSIVVRKAAAKGNSNSVFRNILLQLSKQIEKWEVFTRQLANVFPGYRVKISFDETRDETIKCQVEKDGNEYPIDTCGTGILQAIQILAYVNLFQPTILLLDEPDSHLHPNNQKKLAKIIEQIAENGTSVLAATHSRHLIEALYDESKIIWMKEGSIVDEIDDYDLKALIDIGALNVGEKIRNPKYIFLAEDKNYDLFQTLLDSSEYNSDDYEIIPYAGCTQIGTATALISYLKKNSPDSKYAIYRDRDFLSQTEIEEYKRKFNDMDVRVFIPAGNDIEAYFVAIPHLINALGIDEIKAKDIRTRTFEKRKDELIARYVNTRIENNKKAGIPIDAGAIAAEANRAIVNSESECLHGKIFMKGIRDILREDRIEDRMNSISVALKLQELKDLFST